MKIFSLLTFQLISLTSWATDPYPKNDAIDIRHYHFLLEVNDSTNVIYGEASLSIFFKKSISTFSIDLASKDNSGKGMEVIEVSMNGTKVNYTHLNAKLKITLASPVKANETLIFKINYRGEPNHGIFLEKNKSDA